MEHVRSKLSRNGEAQTNMSRLCYLLRKLLESDYENFVNPRECSLVFRSFKGLRFVALSWLNASNCHDHEILAIPNVLTTTNVRISSLCCIRNRLKTSQTSALFLNLASHLCDFDVLSKSKFGLRPEKSEIWADFEFKKGAFKHKTDSDCS